METMRRLILGLAIVAVGCEKTGEARPILRGTDKSPHTSEGKKVDGRYVEFVCASCGEPIDDDSAECSCKSKVTWADSYPCPNCRGSGDCQACLVYGTLVGAEKGSCWKCSDGWTADNVLCPNCRVDDKTSDGKCPMCKSATAKCDWCKGENGNTLTREQLNEHKKKEAAPATETPAPETPPSQ
jgi:hypothetical protein